MREDLQEVTDAYISSAIDVSGHARRTFIRDTVRVSVVALAGEDVAEIRAAIIVAVGA